MAWARLVWRWRRQPSSKRSFPKALLLYRSHQIVGREQTVTTIADALRLVLYVATDRSEQLIQYLRDKALLLVLDNFEHFCLIRRVWP